MESPEGRGIARRAWEAYVKKSNQVAGPLLDPLLRPAAETVSRAVMFDLYGFWLAWHLEGGFEGMRERGMSRSAIYRRIKMFRSLTGYHPDEYMLPGVTLDVETYLRESPAFVAESRARRAAAKKAR